MTSSLRPTSIPLPVSLLTKERVKGLRCQRFWTLVCNDMVQEKQKTWLSNKSQVKRCGKWKESGVESSKATPRGKMRNGGPSCGLCQRRFARDHGWMTTRWSENANRSPCIVTWLAAVVAFCDKSTWTSSWWMQLNCKGNDSSWHLSIRTTLDQVQSLLQRSWQRRQASAPLLG
jgi:hypothetical protein